uniref:Knr4/Smi1-like domain-containing protein n=1 Tax=uncultured bacterium A1Q1_fos_91 TaxID=1256591 RepID=L7VZA4_9BACT|nr:hypothetical protein [uncultured bacterium A1Q1_fos_91]
MSFEYSRYRHLAIERAEPPPTRVELLRLQWFLGARLPASYRAFLEVGNGGEVDYVVDVPLACGGHESLSFSSFFSTHGTTFGSLLFEAKAAREYAKAPKGVLPIARSGGSSMLCLDLSTEGNGRVMAFVQGLPAWTGLREQSHYTELAESFDAYVGLLRIDREHVLDVLARDAKQVSHVDAMEAWLTIGLPEWREDDLITNAIALARARIQTSAK